MLLQAIGTIRTPYQTLEVCPNAPEADLPPSEIRIAPEFEDGLLGIDAASHLIVLYWLGEVSRSALQSPTARDGVVRGAFANRAPDRPNPIAVSTVKLIKRNGLTLTVGGLDCLNQTVLLDLKPYFVRIDSVPNATVAWDHPPEPTS